MNSGPASARSDSLTFPPKQDGGSAAAPAVRIAARRLVDQLAVLVTEHFKTRFARLDSRAVWCHSGGGEDCPSRRLSTVLTDHSWTGNMRELPSAVKHARVPVVTCSHRNVFRKTAASSDRQRAALARRRTHHDDPGRSR
jgi:transcriptional regulator with PAS, ATPase and Fis domain